MFAAGSFELRQGKKIFSPLVSCCSWIICIILPYRGSEVPDAEIHPRDSVFGTWSYSLQHTSALAPETLLFLKFFKNTPKWRRFAHCILPKEFKKKKRLLWLISLEVSVEGVSG